MLSVFLSCTRIEISPPEPQEIQILYSGRMDGDIEPCG